MPLVYSKVSLSSVLNELFLAVNVVSVLMKRYNLLFAKSFWKQQVDKCEGRRPVKRTGPLWRMQDNSSGSCVSHKVGNRIGSSRLSLEVCCKCGLNIHAFCKRILQFVFGLFLKVVKTFC